MFDVKPDKYEGKPLDRRLIVRKDNCKGIKSLYRLTLTVTCTIPLIWWFIWPYWIFMPHWSFGFYAFFVNVDISTDALSKYWVVWRHGTGGHPRYLISRLEIFKTRVPVCYVTAECRRTQKLEIAPSALALL